jgi:hypothetical protein
MRELNSGSRNPMYGRKGKLSPRFGKGLSGESLERMRQALIGRTVPKEVREKISKSISGENHPNYGKHFSEKTLLKMSVARKGKKRPHAGVPRSEKTRKKMSLARRGIKNHFYGKHHSTETKRKLRIANIEYIQAHGGFVPAIGFHETDLLNKQETVDNVKILRQYPLEKLGYVVDGYCPETNIVYEVYERFHDAQVQQDLERETEICNTLSCDFVILWDR